MQRFLALLVLSGISAQAQTLMQTFGSGTNQFTMDFVTIGNPGNAADTTGSPSPVGSVAYTYQIGKHEVSREMIEKATSAGSLGITLQDMTSFGGNGASRAATGISWYEAAKFVNWLNTSSGKQAAYNFDGSGNFQIWGAGQYSGSNRFRHKDAFYVLPTVDEWYKAAYGSPSGTWYNYPTGSNSAPTAVTSGTLLNTAVYNQGSNTGPADITNAGGLSAYGTMAQAGNVWEWNETAKDLVNDSSSEARELRGGSWLSSSSLLVDSYRRPAADDPANEIHTNGFRVASVPEPTSLSLLLAGVAVLMTGRRKRG